MPRNTRSDPCRSKHGRPKCYPATGDVQYCDTALFILCHTPGQVWHKAFFRWVWAQGWSPDAFGISKNAYGPVGIPLIRGAQAPGNKPLEGSKSLGEGPLGPKEISRCRDTLGQIRAAVKTAGQSATRQLKRCTIGILRYLMTAPVLGYCGIYCTPHLTGKCGTRHFFRFVRAQGRCPHALDIPKNTYGPVSLPLIKGASGAGRWPPRRW